MNLNDKILELSTDDFEELATKIHNRIIDLYGEEVFETQQEFLSEIYEDLRNKFIEITRETLTFWLGR